MQASHTRNGVVRSENEVPDVWSASRKLSSDAPCLAVLCEVYERKTNLFHSTGRVIHNAGFRPEAVVLPHGPERAWRPRKCS